MPQNFHCTKIKQKKIALGWTIVIAYRNQIDAQSLEIVEEIRPEMVGSLKNNQNAFPSQKSN